MRSILVARGSRIFRPILSHIYKYIIYNMAAQEPLEPG